MTESIPEAVLSLWGEDELKETNAFLGFSDTANV